MQTTTLTKIEPSGISPHRERTEAVDSHTPTTDVKRHPYFSEEPVTAVETASWYGVDIGYGLASFVVRASCDGAAVEAAEVYCRQTQKQLRINPDSLFNQAAPLEGNRLAFYERIKSGWELEQQVSLVGLRRAQRGERPPDPPSDAWKYQQLALL